MLLSGWSEIDVLLSKHDEGSPFQNCHSIGIGDVAHGWTDQLHERLMGDFC